LAAFPLFRKKLLNTKVTKKQVVKSIKMSFFSFVPLCALCVEFSRQIRESLKGLVGEAFMVNYAVLKRGSRANVSRKPSSNGTAGL
jgi:hypothetical protein